MSMIGSSRRTTGQTIPVLPPPQSELTPAIMPEEWSFLTSFESEYGYTHPFFYACQFTEALKMARDESKLVFIYLHSPENPYTAPFCRNTLCSELVVEFLDANFISWGAMASSEEGVKMSNAMQAASFPFFAVVAPASADSIDVLQKVEGPVTPDQLVEVLQRTMDEHETALRRMRADDEERIREIRQLREEQDAAYLASLQADKEKEKFRDVFIEEGLPTPQMEAWKKANRERAHREPTKKQSRGKGKEATKDTQQRKETVVPAKDKQFTKILIRFPNGERRDHTFHSTDKIQSIYKFIDSLCIPGIGSYRLISSFPRKVYGFEQLGQTLKDAGLHPSATLFLELLHLDNSSV
ncbi:hypothetical protein QJS10_CPB17g00270 [Acorus calamus]|uniref:UBX domain-containing protein n=1 Tax=Acorus calamus TaxID=4465 RepID=A0AAV9CSC0_ACOCL|nr:hypothetical protein QJS10_CPB17g00270 [Acorus calamus]